MKRIAAQAIPAAAKVKTHGRAGTFDVLGLDGLVDLVVLAINARQILALRQAIKPVGLQSRPRESAVLPNS